MRHVLIILKKYPLRNTLALLALLTTSGCSNLSQQEQRWLTGAAIGTGAGVAVAGIAGGSVLVGGLLGAGAGALGGELVDQQED